MSNTIEILLRRTQLTESGLDFITKISEAATLSGITQNWQEKDFVTFCRKKLKFEYQLLTSGITSWDGLRRAVQAVDQTKRFIQTLHPITVAEHIFDQRQPRISRAHSIPIISKARPFKKRRSVRKFRRCFACGKIGSHIAVECTENIFKAAKTNEITTQESEEVIEENLNIDLGDFVDVDLGEEAGINSQ